jgi:hypothetical protein
VLVLLLKAIKKYTKLLSLLYITNWLYLRFNWFFYSKYKFYIDNVLILWYLFTLLMFKIINTIIRFFILLFGNYCALLMGVKLIKLNFLNILKISLFIILTYLISYFVLGITRLYFVWFLIFVFGFIKLITNYFNNYNIKYSKIYNNKNINDYSFWLKFKQFFSIYLICEFSNDVELKNKDYVKNIYKIFYKSIYTQIDFLYLNNNGSNFESRYNKLKSSYVIFFNYESWFSLCIRELNLLSIGCWNNPKGKSSIMLECINLLSLRYNLNILEVDELKKKYIIDLS